ncbi:MAG: hypothetical protein ABI646_04205 [Acidobacteriota bacterium]
MPRRKMLMACLLVLFVFTFITPAATAAKPSEYKSIVRHLKTKYRAKKVKIPFMWLARFAVNVVRPAGVKSFSVTLFEDLKFSGETVGKEMQSVLKNSFTAEWSPILRARTAKGQQAYMYMREDGKNIRVALVTIDKENAAVIRATFSPERLADFMNDPKVFGISLNEKIVVKEEEPKKETVPAPTQ